MSGRLTELEVDPSGVAILTLRDASRKNALSVEMVEELEDRCASVSQDQDIRALILAGSEEYFSTGANRAVLDRLVSGRTKPRDLLLPRALLDIPVPVVAAMAGYAIGGGLALGLCADITIVARESRYGATFMRYAFTPGLGLTALLEHLMGPALAHEMLLTGQTFRGSHFEVRGAFNYVLPRSQVLAKALAVAAVLAEKPRLALVTLKLALSARKRELFEAARTTECLMHEITFSTREVECLIEELPE